MPQTKSQWIGFLAYIVIEYLFGKRKPGGAESVLEFLGLMGLKLFRLIMKLFSRRKKDESEPTSPK